MLEEHNADPSAASPAAAPGLLCGWSQHGRVVPEEKGYIFFSFHPQITRAPLL